MPQLPLADRDPLLPRQADRDPARAGAVRLRGRAAGRAGGPAGPRGLCPRGQNESREGRFRFCPRGQNRGGGRIGAREAPGCAKPIGGTSCIGGVVSEPATGGIVEAMRERRQMDWPTVACQVNAEEVLVTYAPERPRCRPRGCAPSSGSWSRAAASRPRRRRGAAPRRSASSGGSGSAPSRGRPGVHIIAIIGDRCVISRAMRSDGDRHGSPASA